MSDLINRDYAIDDLHSKSQLQIWDTEDVEVWVNSLPSAEPERKKGKWLPIDVGYYHYVKCSQCGETLVWGENFCPNCGADMREGEEE